MKAFYKLDDSSDIGYNVCSKPREGFTEYDTENVPLELQTLFDAELLKNSKIMVVTMRQARLALLQSNLLTTIEDAIANGTDEAMKIEWEYSTSVNRDWESLIALTTSLGMTDTELDDLFLLASTL